MELKKLEVTAFADLLASDAPAPGGGSTAALEGALGAALTAMVCGLTVGKAKYAASQELVESVREKCAALQVRFLDVMDRDTEAFNAVAAAFALPKGTEEEKAARSKAIQAALRGCIDTPMEMMELAAETLELTESLLGRFNDSAASDLGVAALSLRSAIQGAWLNVRINISSIKDQDLAERSRERGEALLAKALPAADRIYNAVLEMM
mgnify:FL=1